MYENTLLTCLSLMILRARPGRLAVRLIRLDGVWLRPKWHREQARMSVQEEQLAIFSVCHDKLTY